MLQLRPIFFFTLLVLAILMILPVETWSQCPMCRMSAESNLRHGGTEGKGLNTGILYMLTIPYIIVGVIGYIWYRNRKNA